jgi:hypothetical protein
VRFIPRLLLWLVMIGSLGAFEARAQGIGGQGGSASAFSLRQVLEASARKGDVGAKWGLGGLYAEQGNLERSWFWIGSLKAEGDERVYFKSWVAWRVGSLDSALRDLEAGDCKSDACTTLAVNVCWDLGEDTKANSFAQAAYAISKTSSSFYLVLLTTMTAKDYVGFDRLIAEQPWRDSTLFEAWRPAIMILVKARSNL